MPYQLLDVVLNGTYNVVVPDCESVNRQGQDPLGISGYFSFPGNRSNHDHPDLRDVLYNV